jgi:hypothetical protein
MKKVKNILKGYESKFNIEEITVFDTDSSVRYSGSYEQFMDTKESDGLLWEEWKRILNSDCEKCIPFNNRKLFVFLYRHECFDCANKTPSNLCRLGVGHICHGRDWEPKGGERS